MSDNSDKTRIKSSAKPMSGDNDVTRIVDRPGNSDGVISDDATRLAGTKQNYANDDSTRIAIKHTNQNRLSQPGLESTRDNDVTSFNPEVRRPADKTRLAQTGGDSSREAIIPDGNTASPVDDEPGYGILKERFILEEVLGAGGMGIVYKARDKLKIEAQDRDPYVAIKVLSEEFKSHPEAFISLQRESRKSQRIAHPNIVNVHDFDRDGDTVFMTMEFLDGSPLDKLIRQYKSTGLPTDDAWSIIHGMSSALAYAHAQRIIHSDFKPGNVFVTNAGVAKVFDFGIARAVAQVEQVDDNPEDRTVFDAGNLGALTPAYASLEMLQGEEPDIRDDIYALGCVAYELFTGTHPYNKIPADEAERQGLKPARIANIKKYQWKAIEKAIAFRRENRIESIDKFIEALSPKVKTTNRLISALVLVVSISITIYFAFFQEKQIDPYAEFNIRSELELKIKIEFYREDLENLLKNPDFTDPWQDSVWKDVSDLTILTKGGADWLTDKKQQIYQLYIEKINANMVAYQYSMANSLIENARRYTDDMTELDQRAQLIAQAIQQARDKKQKLDDRLQERAVSASTQKVDDAVVTSQKQGKSVFDVALDNVTNQLKCNGRLNMRDFESAIDRLKQIDRTRYNKLESGIIDSLASCISQMSRAFPERAAEAKRSSLRIFNNHPVIASISIKSRDPCDQSLAGLGSRGKRAICKDKIKSGGNGPELVVIPGNSKFNAFAIGKYEISINEMNQYCKHTGQCKVISDKDLNLPASELDLSIAKNYLKWLSKNSGQKYRLPTRNEWLYAATSQRKSLDANRNCKLNTRGIEKGDGLIQVNIGKQNSWGLVNYVGNVQEWVYDKGRQLVAVGGSYKESMDKCDITTSVSHSGSPDRSTGFRVLRELGQNS